MDRRIFVVPSFRKKRFGNYTGIPHVRCQMVLSAFCETMEKDFVNFFYIHRNNLRGHFPTMKIPLMKNFLCFDLVTGGLIIGWANIILLSVMFCFTVAMMDESSPAKLSKRLVCTTVNIFSFGALIVGIKKVK